MSLEEALSSRKECSFTDTWIVNACLGTEMGISLVLPGHVKVSSMQIDPSRSCFYILQAGLQQDFVQGSFSSLPRQVFSEYFTQCPVNHDFFPGWLMGTELFLILSTVTINSFRFFPCHWVIPSQVRADEYSVLLWYWLSLSVLLPPLQYSVLWTLAVLHSQFSLLNSEVSLGSAYVPSPYTVA